MLIAIAQDGRLINTTELSDRMHVSPKYLRKLAGTLEKAGWIRSTQGIHGGYEINKKPEEITMQMLLDACGERMALSACVMGENCELKGSCQARPVWEMLDKKLQECFLPITLSDILQNKIEKP
jgi:Rrf2 family protein